MQWRWNIARGDAQRKAFDHGGLADAGFAREDGVVLAATHQDVDDLPYLGIATDDRVDLAICGALREVGGELVEGRAARMSL